MSILVSIENILKKVKAVDEHFFPADLLRWAVVNTFVSNLLPLKARALHRINPNTDSPNIDSTIVSGIPEAYLIDEAISFPSDEALAALIRLRQDYQNKARVSFKEHRKETISFICTSSHPLIKQTYPFFRSFLGIVGNEGLIDSLIQYDAQQSELEKIQLSNEEFSKTYKIMTRAEVKSAVLNYIDYKNNRFWGLSWLFSSQESKTCFDQLWSPNINDETRYQIASRFITQYPQKQFAICLEQILKGGSDKEPLLVL